MNNDIILGFLLAVPLYAIILLLFKDIIVRGFINSLLEHSTAQLVGPEMNAPFTKEDFKKSVESDLLASYKLFLLLREEFDFLYHEKSASAATPTDKKLAEVYNSKMKELSYVIKQTENIFDEMGSTDYRDIKGNLDDALKDRTLF